MKAWRAYKPNALIVGGDIDPDAVAQTTEWAFQVDQTSSMSLATFKMKVSEKSSEFDLIIDDGFHDPHANIRTYLELQDLIATKGRYIVEDVHESLINFWLIISRSLPGEMRIIDLSDQRPDLQDNILIEFRKND